MSGLNGLWCWLMNGFVIFFQLLLYELFTCIAD